MKTQVLIENHGVGNIVVIQKGENLEDIFVDPQNLERFYPPSAIIKAKITRKISKLGGYFLSLPNGKKG